MRVTKKPNLAKYKKAIDGMSDKTLPIEAQETIKSIQARTSRGVDADGKGFEPYKNKSYYKKKGVAFVNLQDTGIMLHSITYKKIKDGIRLYFASANANKKAYHNQVTNKRKFFALDDKQTTYLLNAVKKWWRNTK